MKSKLIHVGVLALIIILAVMSGLAIGQFSRTVYIDWNRLQSQSSDAETKETTSATDALNTARGAIDTGTLDLIGNAWVVTTQGKPKRLSVNDQTAIYIQGETLFQTNQGGAALQTCALEHCPVYVVWSAQSDVASAIVLALSTLQQTRFPDPDPDGKTPIPWPSPTPPWIRLPSVVPATPLVERATSTPRK